MKSIMQIGLPVLALTTLGISALASPPMQKKDVTVVDEFYTSNGKGALQTRVIKYVDDSGAICFVTYLHLKGSIPADAGAATLSAPAISCVK